MHGLANKMSEVAIRACYYLYTQEIQNGQILVY